VNSDLIDYAHHMSYDFFWGTMKSASGPFRAPGEILYPYMESSPIERSVYGSLNYLFNKGCSASKMTSGIPFYSTHVEAWNQIRDRADWASIPLDPDYLEKLEMEEARYNWVNDPEAIAAKIREYKNLGLQGIIVWQVGLEGTTGDLSAAILEAASGGLPPSYACSDGRDNDSDGLVDYPEDPGCASETDDDEFNGAASYACSDELDNDGDGFIDYPEDPGCADENDNDEYNAPPSGELRTVLTISSDWGSGYCANVEVINDTSVDEDWVVAFDVEGPITSLWSASYVQSGNEVTAEGRSWNNIVAAGSSVSLGFCADRGVVSYECSDGIDNDEDGLTDYPDDPGCEGSEDDDEYNAPAPIYECDDGIDNDGDGLVDYPDDPGCASPGDNDEIDIQAPEDEVEAVTTITSDRGSGYCANVEVKNNGDEPLDWAVTIEIEGNISSLWNALYEMSGNELNARGLSWNDIIGAGLSTSFGFCAVR